MILNSRITYLPRRNFTAAHELGHYFIREHFGQDYLCTLQDMNGYKAGVPKTLRAREYEANVFAAELLLPTENVRNELRNASPDIGTVRRIAELFSTSLTASARRVVGLSDECCAVVMSQHGYIQWSLTSPLANALGVEIRVGPLDSGSLASDLFEPSCTPSPQGEVQMTSWLSCRGRLPDSLLHECSIEVGPYQVLTMLWVPELDEEALEEIDL